MPGPYTAAELEAQGDAVAAAVANNASFNCNSAKLLVQAKGWSGRERFREAITASLERVPPRHAYYPGAAQRWHELVDTHPKARRIGSAGEGELPWALLPDLDPADDGEVCFHMEPWCSAISETAVGTDDPVDFIAAATRFVNERVWGTLVATVVIHPDTASEPRFAAALERALDELRYGTVSLNQWPAVGFALGTAPWGGYPSSTLEDIQSGRGWVRNAWLLNERDIEKVVIRAPLVPRPKPVWYAGHRRANALGKQIVAMEASPSVLRLPGLLWSVLRG